MKKQRSSTPAHYCLCLLLCLSLSACVGSIVGAAVDTTIEVAKVPFKVAGAAIDLVVPDADDDNNE